MENIKTSIGMYFDLTNQVIEHSEQAEEKIDIRIKVGEQVKDFTLKEFKELLGFNRYENIFRVSTK